MMNDEASMIYLTKTDPAQNMSRFYTLDIQPTLFGEWALLREWGRIGRAGQSRRALFGGGKRTQEARQTGLRASLIDCSEHLYLCERKKSWICFIYWCFSCSTARLSSLISVC
jgi:predicted DNA-binding WGR domain protein